MGKKTKKAPLTRNVKMSPSESFSHYCELQFERNRDSDENFEEAAYEEAIKLTLRKLHLLEKGGYA